MLCMGFYGYYIKIIIKRNQVHLKKMISFLSSSPYPVFCFFLILFGSLNNKYWMQAIGFGIMAYGAAYFLVHDVIIHQRFKWFTRTSNPYIKRLRRAHKMHHKHLDRHHGESFGMLWVHKRYKDKSHGSLKSN